MGSHASGDGPRGTAATLDRPREPVPTLSFSSDRNESKSSTPDSARRPATNRLTNRLPDLGPFAGGGAPPAPPVVSIGVSRSAPTRPPACVRACACVPVARVWSMGGRTKCIPAETPPQLLAVSGAVTRIETCIQQLLWGEKNANGTSLMYLM